MLDKNIKSKGFTLAETIVAVAVLALISYLVFLSFINVLKVVNYSRARSLAVLIASDKLEIARNLPYDSVGIIDGWPIGVLRQKYEIKRDKFLFEVRMIVRYIDDDLDDVWPEDVSPADYKLVEARVRCLNCRFSDKEPLVKISTSIAPKGLENEEGNGVLSLGIYDANGQPIQGADVLVENKKLLPNISIYDVSNNQGKLTLVNMPPSDESYSIFVSKPGYTLDRTYSKDYFGESTPVKSDLTVADNQITQASFTIDKTSQLKIEPLKTDCSPFDGLSFNLKGSRLVATNPDVFAFDKDYSNVGIEFLVDDLVWDQYDFSLLNNNYYLGGFISNLPLDILPGMNLVFKPIISPANPKSFLVLIKDSDTGLPLEGARVTLKKEGEEIKILNTGDGFIRQDSWLGGPGQENYLDPTGYYYNDYNIDDGDDLTLLATIDGYTNWGEVISSTFDFGTSTNFNNISWLSTGQSSLVGEEAVRIQLASNNDGDTWDFIGPDGSSDTFYTSPSNINPIHNSHRFLRYRLVLTTDDINYSPVFSEISISFSSGCRPAGQVFFEGLASGSYQIIIEKDGYHNFFDDIYISEDWSFYEFNLNNF